MALLLAAVGHGAGHHLAAHPAAVRRRVAPGCCIPPVAACHPVDLPEAAGPRLEADRQPAEHPHVGARHRVALDGCVLVRTYVFVTECAYQMYVLWYMFSVSGRAGQSAVTSYDEWP